MEDPDIIESAYIFDTEPSVETYKELTKALIASQGKNPNSVDIEIRYRDGDQNSHKIDGIYKEIIQIPENSTYIHVTIPTLWDEISIDFDKRGMGLLSYQSTPYLAFSTWIYALQATDDEEHFDEVVKPSRREFAELHAQAANVLDPKWGFGRRCGLAIGKNETVEELADRLKPPLYEYNVFREETVEAIGRDRVLSAPAYYVEELDSGGVFMAVTEPPRQWGHDDQPYEEVADHLGLPPMTPERYH